MKTWRGFEVDCFIFYISLKKGNKIDSNISLNGFEVVLASSQLANALSQQVRCLWLNMSLLTLKWTVITSFCLHSASLEGFLLLSPVISVFFSRSMCLCAFNTMHFSVSPAPSNPDKKTLVLSFCSIPPPTSKNFGKEENWGREMSRKKRANVLQ